MGNDCYILDSDENELIDDEVLIDMVDDFDADEAQQLCDLLNRAWAARMKAIHVKLSQDRFFVLGHVSPECQMQTPKADHFDALKNWGKNDLVSIVLKPDGYGSPVSYCRWVGVQDWQALADREGVDVLVSTLDHKIIGHYKPTPKKPTVTYDSGMSEAELSAMLDTLPTSEAVAAVADGVRQGKYTIDENGYAPIEPAASPTEPTAQPIYVYKYRGDWCFGTDLPQTDSIQDVANEISTRVYHCELSATVQPSDTVYPDPTDGMLLAVFNHLHGSWKVVESCDDVRPVDAVVNTGDIARLYNSPVYMLKIIKHADPELIRYK